MKCWKFIKVWTNFVFYPHRFQDIQVGLKMWSCQWRSMKRWRWPRYFIQKHITYINHSHAVQKEKSFEVSWLNPLWTINVCTNLLAVHSVVETRLKWTDWLLCFTLKKSVWVFRILEGTFHDEQTELSKENHWSKALTSYNAGLLHLIYSCGLWSKKEIKEFLLIIHSCQFQKKKKAHTHMD